jgi:hypothetical protein
MRYPGSRCSGDTGPDAAISHRSGAELWGMADPEKTVHVAVPGRGGREQRDGFVVHRPVRVVRAHRHGVPVMTPTQCLKDAGLQPHELYRALEQADKLWLPVDRPSLPLGDVARVQQAVRGTTRSPAEARFILLCAQNGWELPLVNHRLNGILTDFHWPRQRLVVEVDGYEFHKDRPQFEEDRRRGLVHNAAGYTVTRVSALQVEHTPALVTAALRDVL